MGSVTRFGFCWIVMVVAVAGLAGPAPAGKTAPGAAGLDPGSFAELGSGIILVRASDCAGRRLSDGTGFLVGERLVMTARPVLHGACRVTVRSVSRWIKASGWAFWHRGGTPGLPAADVATVRLASVARGHVFSLRASSASIGMNLAVLGHPLGNRLSIRQGRVYAKGQGSGVALLAVRLSGANAKNGAPLVDDRGRVAGILETGWAHPDFVGPRRSGIVLGIDLPSWWPSLRKDLCRFYPAGGIPSCRAKTAPEPPAPPASPPPPATPAVLTVTRTWMSHDARSPAVASFSSLDPTIYFNADFAVPIASATDVVARWTGPLGLTITTTYTVPAGSSGAYFWLANTNDFLPGEWDVRLFLADGTQLADQSFTVA